MGRHVLVIVIVLLATFKTTLEQSTTFQQASQDNASAGSSTLPSAYVDMEQAQIGEGCGNPTVTDSNFSASQVASLATDLQESMSSECYAIVSTTLAVCLPDLALVEGCFTTNCSRALRLAVPTNCLVELAAYTCSNATYFAQYLSRTSQRCLGRPVPCSNISQWVRADAPAAEESTIATQCDLYRQPKWPEFDTTRIFDVLMAWAEDLPQECLRVAVSAMPICYQDLTVSEGCCSMTCQSAMYSVPVGCQDAILRSMCTKTPFFSRYFLALLQRCQNISSSCNITSQMPDVFDISPREEMLEQTTPVLLPESGICPISQQNWSDYDGLKVPLQFLTTFSQAPAVCEDIVSVISPCSADLPKKQGCCTPECARALSSVSIECQRVLDYLVCKDDRITRYSMSISERCLGYRPSCLLVTQSIPDSFENISQSYTAPIDETPINANAPEETSTSNLQQVNASDEMGGTMTESNGALRIYTGPGKQLSMFFGSIVIYWLVWH